MDCNGCRARGKKDTMTKLANGYWVCTQCGHTWVAKWYKPNKKKGEGEQTKGCSGVISEKEIMRQYLEDNP